MSESLIRFPEGFQHGYTPITSIENRIQMNFGVLKLAAGEQQTIQSTLESAYLLVSGRVAIRLDEHAHEIERSSLFDEDPYVLNFTSQSTLHLHAITDCEFLVCQVGNEKHFAPRFFHSENMLESEHRGKGKLDDTAYRIVRTVFDKRNHDESNMVIGEVITFPGRWSSYPPHHHPQPEIYHYRFSKAPGYGHGQLGENIYKLQHEDTLLIQDNQDHAQVAGPGYGMYYLWAIRHLPENPYTVPEFTKEHEWTMK